MFQLVIHISQLGQVVFVLIFETSQVICLPLEVFIDSRSLARDLLCEVFLCAQLAEQ